MPKPLRELLPAPARVVTATAATTAFPPPCVMNGRFQQWMQGAQLRGARVKSYTERKLCIRVIGYPRDYPEHVTVLPDIP